MRHVLLGGVLVLAFAITGLGLSYAGQERGGWTYGAGTSSCGEWSKYHPDQHTTVTAENVGMHQWVLGFVSGINAAAQKPLPKTDSSAIIAWITQHCAAYPLNTVDTASLVLALELSKRRP